MKKKIIYIPDIPKLKFLKKYLLDYWYAPQDVLQRSLESAIWENVNFNSPSLDIGVGDGSSSKLIFANKKKIDFGVDKNSNFFTTAMKTGLYKKLIRADAAKLPFKRATFNTVVSNSTFEHITDDLSAISEVSRVLKKGGIFFFTVPTNHFPHMIRVIEKHNQGSILSKVNKRLDHKNYHSLTWWSQVLASNNMQIIYYKFFEPFESFKLWYELFSFSTTKFHNKEIWSYLSSSKLSKVIPKSVYIRILFEKMKKNYVNGLKTPEEIGAQVFIAAQKIK